MDDVDVRGDVRGADERGADVLGLAARFIAAVGAADLDTVRELYAADAVIWNNTTGVEMTRDENLAVLRAMHQHLGDVRYEEIRCEPTATGYVEQHVLRATTPRGAQLELPACLVVTVADGRITRLEEYFDSRHLDVLTQRDGA